MDFNLDDPLGDLLSEGSNDSFFENVPKKTTSTPKKSTLANSSSGTSTKGKMEDLFGIKDTSTIPSQSSIPEPDKLSIAARPESNPSHQKKTVSPTKTPIAKTKPPPTKSNSMVFNDDDDDLISDLGFDPKKPKANKSSIFDDILAPIEPKKSIATPARPMTSGNEPKIVSRQSTETTESTVPGTQTTSLPRPKTTGRRQSITSMNDPLGLFGSQGNPALKDHRSSIAQDSQQDVKIKDTPKARRRGTTADWLGLEPEPTKVHQKETLPSGSPVKVSETPQLEKQFQQQTMQQFQGSLQNIPAALSLEQQVTPMTYSIPSLPTSNLVQGSMMMTAATLETQNALQALKQQEAQITAAAAVKSQETILLEMQRRQQDLIAQQELQFNNLLQKQLLKQNQLEMNIRSQQQRINAHIQLLMSNTGLPSGLQNEDDKKTTDGPPVSNEPASEPEKQNLVIIDNKGDEIQLEAEVKRLELEKLRLEDLVSNINSNHEKEIEFIENSHKKQITVLENNLKSIEERLQMEIKSIEEFYLKKINLMETEKNSILSNHEKKLNNIREEYEDIIRNLKQSYESDIESMKDNHRKMIENIRQSKLLEFSVVQENSSYLETLRRASTHLENVSGDLQTLRDEMYTKIDLTTKEREVKLEAKEKRLEDAERRLKLSEETFEEDKSRLVNLVSSLETQLRQQSKDSAEELWLLRQKISMLEAEKSAFEREKEYVREQILRDEKRVEDLKQLQLAENQRLMQQIQDERQFLNTEKIKLQTEKRLQMSTHNQQSRQAEIETAIKIAEDAARQADEERQRYFKMQRTLELQKRELVEQENSIRHKHEELETAILSVKTKERKIQEMFARNRLVEQNLNSRTHIIQTQLRILKEKESEFNQEKLTLTKQRVELQEMKRKLDENKCSLCKIDQKTTEISQLIIGGDSSNQGENENPNTLNNENPTQVSRSGTINNARNRSFQLPSPVPGGLGNFVDINNLIRNNVIDHNFDREIIESLRDMEASHMDINLSNDLNENFTNYEIEQRRFLDPPPREDPSTSYVPLNLDSEIAILNFDIKKNFFNK